MKKKYILPIIIVSTLSLLVYIEKSPAVFTVPFELLYDKEDAFVDNVLLDLGELSDEAIPPKVFFLDVPILTYHQVRPITEKDDKNFRRFITSPEEFERQMQYLHDRGYSIASLNDIVSHLASSSPLKGKYVAITFDDGYQSQYQNALPILKKYNDTATFFIYANAISNLKASMTWDEVVDLDRERMTIGAHTRSHALLTKITDTKLLHDEIQGSKDDIESHLHKPTSLFAYPYGKYNDATISEVMWDGFSGAVGVTMGRLQTYDQRYALKRYNINDNDTQFREIFEKGTNLHTGKDY